LVIVHLGLLETWVAVGSNAPDLAQWQPSGLAHGYTRACLLLPTEMIVIASGLQWRCGLPRWCW
jgi:hypothetical protein